MVTLYDRFADASLTKRMRLSFRSTRNGNSDESADVELEADGPQAR